MHTQSDENPKSGGIGPLLEAMRIPHWIKNIFVAAAILFSGRFDEPRAWSACLAVLGAFCLLSSAVYLINDLFDRASDRAHPIKRERPVASGRLGPLAAGIWAGALILGAGGLAIWAGVLRPKALLPVADVPVWVWLGIYLLVNLLYSIRLKHVIVLDVILVAAGFVLRVMGGAAAVAVPISPWMVLCTFMLCLFLALAKRRGEIVQSSPSQVPDARPVNREYKPGDLERMMTVSAALAIVTYSLYCLAPETVRRVGSAGMIWTIPWVIYGMFHYSQSARRGGGADPVLFVLRDKRMWVVLLGYLISAWAILEFGDAPWFQNLLDSPF